MKRIVLSGQLGKHSLLEADGRERFVYSGQDHKGGHVEELLTTVLSRATEDLMPTLPERYEIEIQIRTSEHPRS